MTYIGMSHREMNKTMNKGQLAGIRVLDLTTDPSGPYAAQNLSGLGAEVIKIERPHIGDPCRWSPPFVGPDGIAYEVKHAFDISVQYLRRNRGKKSIFLSLKNETGRVLFKKLVALSDVVIENFAPGLMEAHDLGYEELSNINPGIIYCSISGYGRENPGHEKDDSDLMVQAASGIMDMSGLPNNSSIRYGAWAGQMIPALWATIAILSALVSRKQAGRGERIDLSMQDACFSAAADEILKTSPLTYTSDRGDEGGSRPAPWNVYPTRDDHIVICAAQNTQWSALLEAMGREDLKGESRFKTQQGRHGNADEIDAIVSVWLKTLTTEKALKLLKNKKIPCEAVSSFEEALENPRLKSRGMIQEAIHPVYGKTGLKASGFPAKFSEMEADFSRPAPYPGQHNIEIYTGLLGLSREYLERLKEEEII